MFIAYVNVSLFFLIFSFLVFFLLLFEIAEGNKIKATANLNVIIYLKLLKEIAIKVMWLSV